MNRFSLRENKLLLLLGFNLALLVISAPRFSESRDTVISYLLFLLMSLGLGLVWYKSKRAAKRRQGRMTGSARIMIKLRRNKTALFGLIVISVVAYLAVLAPFCVPQDPNAIDWSALAAKPSAKHWMGTDELGRDLMSRVIYGMRVALGLGLMAVILNSITGTVLGLLAGYYGGKVDTVIMRILEVWNSIPFILLVIAIMAALGTGLVKLVIVVSLSGIMSFARIIRGSALVLKEQDYISAARVMGFPNWIILLRHLLPNCVAPIIVMASLRIGDTILTVAGLSFLGLGIQPPMASLGYMLASSQQYLSQNIYMSLFPGLAILLIVLSLNLFGDGLRDALDSRLTD